MKRSVPIVGLVLSGCMGFYEPVTQPISGENLVAYANYCAIPYDGIGRSPQSVAASGFASVEQQCGNFFDRLSELTQTGRFGSEALEAANLGTQSIMQAAKSAARSVTIVGASYTLTEAVLNSFIKQYAFSPYLYKIRELTWQAFVKHQTDNGKKLAQLKHGTSADDYCDAAILIQAHASICTLSSIQSLFDQQVARASEVTSPSDKTKKDQTSKPKKEQSAASRALGEETLLPAARSAVPPDTYVPLVTPNYTVR